MGVPDYGTLTDKLLEDENRGWRTWQGFEVGDSAIDIYTTFVVTIESVHYPQLKVAARYPHGALFSVDPEGLIALSHKRRSDAYKHWCLSVGRIDLWDNFDQIELQMQEEAPLIAELAGQDDDAAGMLIDCGHITQEPWRCPKCQELLCQVCKEVHKCFTAT
jgi:hypothetical protein